MITDPEEMGNLRIRTLNEEQKRQLRSLSKEEIEGRNEVIKDYIESFPYDLSLDIACKINTEREFVPPISGYQVRGHKVWKTICLKQEEGIPIEIDDDDLEFYIEGARREVVINKIERNPVIRERALEIHGKKCQICDYEPYQKYQQCNDAVGLIAHHKNQLSETGEIYVNPVEDIAIVCAVCHYLIHENSDYPLTIEDAIQKIVRNK